MNFLIHCLIKSSRMPGIHLLMGSGGNWRSINPDLFIQTIRERKQTAHSPTRGGGSPADGGTWEEKVESVCAGEGSGPAGRRFCSPLAAAAAANPQTFIHQQDKRLLAEAPSWRPRGRRRAPRAARPRAPECLNVRTVPQRRLLTAAGPPDGTCDLVAWPGSDLRPEVHVDA